MRLGTATCMTAGMATVLAPGRRGPFGAHAADGGVNLALWSEHATAIDWCLFDADGMREVTRHRLHRGSDGVFHGLLPGAGPGLVYGLRAHGPHAPREGHRFNPAKLLLDPWAREIVGRFDWRPEHHGYHLGASPFDTVDTADNAAWALKARVAPPRPAAPSSARPRHAPAARVLYEVHVRSFSMRHPAIPPALRGTYAALAHPASIAHFRHLGVTTLSLLPVQYRLSEPMMPPGLVNHWGYNTLGFFCPDPRLAAAPGDPTAVADEFRAMVAALHAAGLEVVLDVVYNHTPEGNHCGPTLAFRGLDQRSWYRVAGDGTLVDFTHCGNTLNVAHPRVARFVVDSLVFWAREMGVDGFRFDLAPVLGRGADGAFSRDAAFFGLLREEPALGDVVLIAEPWDGGPRGYRVGGFPPPWLEWNDRFRDAARGFWLGCPGPNGPVTRREMAARLAGSPDLYEADGRPPTSGVNFVAVHDGFTLADLVSYARKRNHANGEGNRDGRDDELSAHLGASDADDGPTADPALRATRSAVQRALLATLLLAQGTPMLHGGDEIGRSQQGNNNAWNQDNALSWLDWTAADDALAGFVAALSALRREAPFARPAAWHGARLRAFAVDDDAAAALALRSADGRWLLALNPDAAPRPLPPEALDGADWACRLDTAVAPVVPAAGAEGGSALSASATPATPSAPDAQPPLAPLAPRSLRLLQRRG
jgi:isoamylase